MKEHVRFHAGREAPGDRSARRPAVLPDAVRADVGKESTKKLKKLLSPSSLAATIATGMLLHSAVTALAGEWFSVSAVTYPLDCGPQTRCRYYCTGVGYVYWCCSNPASCPDGNGSAASRTYPYMGWCVTY
jgi:hypothetical protein